MARTRITEAQLPPLPEPGVWCGAQDKRVNFTADQLQAYALEAVTQCQAQQEAAPAVAAQPVVSITVKRSDGELRMSFAPERAGLDLPDGEYMLCLAPQPKTDFDPFAGHAPVKTVQTPYGKATAYVAAQPEPAAQDPLQCAADWLFEAIAQCDAADIQHRLSIGYNRAERLLDAARSATKTQEGA